MGKLLPKLNVVCVKWATQQRRFLSVVLSKNDFREITQDSQGERVAAQWICYTFWNLNIILLVPITDNTSARVSRETAEAGESEYSLSL